MLLCGWLPGPIRHFRPLLGKDLRRGRLPMRHRNRGLRDLCRRASLPRAPRAVSLQGLPFKIIFRAALVSVMASLSAFRANPRGWLSRAGIGSQAILF